MELLVDGHRREFMPIGSFREKYNLPESFEIGMFATADADYNPFWVQVSQLYDELSERLCQVVPMSLTPAKLTEVPLLVATIFEHELVAAGVDMELTRDEVEITTTDFQNVLEPAVYKLVELNYLNNGDKTAVRQHFDIDAIYQEMVDSSVFVNLQTHDYQHIDKTWVVYTVHSVYGPVGLKVETAEGAYFVEDQSLAFPASNFIEKLSKKVGQEICDVFTEA